MSKHNSAQEEQQAEWPSLWWPFQCFCCDGKTQKKKFWNENGKENKEQNKTMTRLQSPWAQHHRNSGCYCHCWGTYIECGGVMLQCVLTHTDTHMYRRTRNTRRFTDTSYTEATRGSGETHWRSFCIGENGDEEDGGDREKGRKDNGWCVDSTKTTRPEQTWTWPHFLYMTPAAPAMVFESNQAPVQHVQGERRERITYQSPIRINCSMFTAKQATN